MIKRQRRRKKKKTQFREWVEALLLGLIIILVVKGALVDLRMGPHEAVSIRRTGKLSPFRGPDGGELCRERAYGDVGNFVRSPDGREIPGNEGTPWPPSRADSPVF